MSDQVGELHATECPHCHEFCDLRDSYYRSGEGKHSVNCSSCGKDFAVILAVHVEVWVQPAPRDKEKS